MCSLHVLVHLRQRRQVSPAVSLLLFPCLASPYDHLPGLLGLFHQLLVINSMHSLFFFIFSESSQDDSVSFLEAFWVLFCFVSLFPFPFPYESWLLSRHNCGNNTRPNKHRNLFLGDWNCVPILTKNKVIFSVCRVSLVSFEELQQSPMSSKYVGVIQM